MKKITNKQKRGPIVIDIRAGPRDVVAGGALKARVLNRAAEAARFRRKGVGV